MQPVFRAHILLALDTSHFLGSPLTHLPKISDLFPLPAPKAVLDLPFSRKVDRKQLGGIPGSKSSTHLFLNPGTGLQVKRKRLSSLFGKVKSERVSGMMGNIYSFGGSDLLGLYPTVSMSVQPI